MRGKEVLESLSPKLEQIKHMGCSEGYLKYMNQMWAWYEEIDHHFRKQIWYGWKEQFSLKVSFTLLFPACSIKPNSQEMCLRNFNPLSNTCSDLTGIPNIQNYFYHTPQKKREMGEQTSIPFNLTQFLLLFFWPHTQLSQCQKYNIHHFHIVFSLHYSCHHRMQHIAWNISDKAAAIYITNVGLMKLSNNSRNLLLAKKLFWILSLVHFSFF